MQIAITDGFPRWYDELKETMDRKLSRLVPCPLWGGEWIVTE
jgi:hypothetical protein